ncbi:hypothetical protein [Mesorhizobium sp. B263B2A]|uniref:hypothetical protein n=1 Tax=Mesorhizobium sp. B263B2A TaxID=2876669 RepID=UPI001CD1091D|nr:hypothetical protein [Mesorhizobium sp. B263B2A]MCA0032710.1 hypothetical protein [Mesorhizobium sp. B263B2A]
MNAAPKAKSLTEAQVELNAAGFWCTFKHRRTVLHVGYTPQVDGGVSQHVATFNRLVEQTDIDRLIVWKNRQMAAALAG